MIANATSGVYLYSALGALIWVAIAFLPATMAARKGHSFAGYFTLSMFFFPLALILAHLAMDREEPIRDDLMSW